MNAYAIFVVNEHLQDLLDEAAARRQSRSRSPDAPADRFRCVLGQGDPPVARRLQRVDHPEPSGLSVPELRPPPLAPRPSSQYTNGPRFLLRGSSCVCRQEAAAGARTTLTGWSHA